MSRTPVIKAEIPEALRNQLDVLLIDHRQDGRDPDDSSGRNLGVVRVTKDHVIGFLVEEKLTRLDRPKVSFFFDDFHHAYAYYASPFEGEPDHDFDFHGDRDRRIEEGYFPAPDGKI